MALESLEAARAAEEARCWRSCVSRCYYAAYQAATAVLVHVGPTPPAGREGWSHSYTPGMLRDHLRGIVRQRATRNDVGYRLAKLYKARLAADYTGSQPITSILVETARRDAAYIMKVARTVLPPRG